MNTTGTHEPEVTFSNVAGGIRGFQLAEMVCMHLWLLRVRQDNQSLKAATVKSSEEMVKRPNKVQVWVRASRSKKENASMRGPQCPGQISPKFGSVREPESTHFKFVSAPTAIRVLRERQNISSSPYIIVQVEIGLWAHTSNFLPFLDMIALVLWRLTLGDIS